MANSKKTTTTKPRNPTSALHPPYFQMISEAITTLKDRTGSSQPAIAKFIEENYQNTLPPNFKKLLSIQLKKFVKSERLVKVKNSYKISVSEKGKQLTAAIKQSQRKKEVQKVTTTKNKPPKKAAKEVLDKAVKTKKLAAAEKAKKDAKKPATGGKMKRLSQVKTPEAMKKQKTSTPMKRKATSATKPVKSSRTKKAKN